MMKNEIQKSSDFSEKNRSKIHPKHTRSRTLGRKDSFEKPTIERSTPSKKHDRTILNSKNSKSMNLIYSVKSFGNESEISLNCFIEPKKLYDG